MSGNIIFLIPIVAIAGGILLSAYKLHLNAKTKARDTSADDLMQKEIIDLKQQVIDLQERTKVLEKIVTSENYDLKSKIDSL